jgi:hypothetical protein
VNVNRLSIDGHNPNVQSKRQFKALKESMPKVDVKVIEALAVMARYNPFFEKAGIIRVEYSIDRSSKEKKIKCFLESHNFDFDFLKSKNILYNFFYETPN